MNSRHSLKRHSLKRRSLERRSRKSAGCVYMLGFLSGLVFIVLCGSTATYNRVSNPRIENKPVKVNEKALPNAALDTIPQTIGEVNISFGRSAQGDEFTIQALEIEPGTQAVVQIQDGDRVLATKTVTADINGTIYAEFEPLTETLFLAQVDIYVIVGETPIHKTYPLPTVADVGNIPTTTEWSQSPVVAASPDTPTPSPTPIAPPPAPPATAPPMMPTLTPIPFPTPVPMESYYPNWRAEYYNNATWANVPVIVRDDPSIAFNWGAGSPIPGAIGQNWFSVRWTRHIVLPEGYYRFVLTADDQAEVYINGHKLMSYTGKSPYSSQVTRYIQGFEPLDIEVKYAEYWGNAHIRFYWEQDEEQGCCWTTTYYQGVTAAGEPAHREVLPGNDLSIAWNPADNYLWAEPFSAHITRQLQAPHQPGDYHLCVYTHENVRVWLDSNLLVDHQSCEECGCLICSRARLGNNPLHNLALEYSHTWGDPYLGFLMTPAKEGEPWIGAFFDNPEMIGPPVAIRTAADIDFDWQDAGPPDTGVPFDGFAVRWQRPLDLVYGQYRFYVRVDDGARLRVNGYTLIDEWNIGAVRDFSATYDVWGSSEKALVELDYFENTGKAAIKLWWDAPPPTPTPTSTPTRTPNP